MTKEYQIAEINIARMKGVSMDDPIMKEFVDNVNAVNEIAEKSNGFVWRLLDEDKEAANFSPFTDEQVIINISVWETIASLETFMYKTFHSDFLKRRKEWFYAYGKVATAMWWIPKGDVPTIQEAAEKLEYIQKNGPSEVAFSFRYQFPKPGEEKN
ncbi:DUF3291 domain-containing protein [Mariniflexile sp. AS56]|uniref:DUF3291 domain-containing protein n=1 Tax=Mariniflexile sp. AS56 TaxID=3063957 RepID=UPI0026ED90F7|nr:DUF3291 domain-containing protein [Mariniflexile sp. AS56]MDO7173796.1 DUF3291 domain-containing protein [Mariniflexile sp. AS56]